MNGSAKMNRRIFLVRSAAGLMTVSLSRGSLAADPLKIGLIIPKTGPFASTGKQIEAACRLYIAKHGDTVAGRKVDLIVMDDTTSVIPQRSPFIVRSGFTLPQVTAPIADWAVKNGIKKVVTLVSD